MNGFYHRIIILSAMVFAFGQPIFAKGYIVKFKEGIRSATSLKQAQLLSTGSGLGSSISRVEIETESDLQALQERSEVEYVEPDFTVHADLVPNDPAFISEQWSLSNLSTGSSIGGADIDIEKAWDVTTGKSDVFMFFFDTGMDEAIEPLKQNLHSFGEEVLGIDILRGDSEPDPESNHGTHVASIAAARGNEGYGIAGVVWNASIVPVKFLDAKDEGSISDVIKGYEFMAKTMKQLLAENPKRRFIASNSWGGEGYSRALFDAMKKVQELGALVVASSGNHGQNVDEFGYYPCRYPLSGLICVAASDATDRLTGFSGYGISTVHIMAPGDRITGYVGSHATGSTVLPELGRKSGTSQAVPHVTGVAALIWSLNPEYSAEQVMGIILQSSDHIPSTDDKLLSGGRLNAFAAVSLAKASSPETFKIPNGYFESRRNSADGCSISTGMDHSTNFTCSFVLLIAILLTLLLLRRTEF